MKFIFFQSPVNPDKVAFTVSSKPVRVLQSEGVIPKSVKTLVMDYAEPEKMDAELFLMLYNLDCVKFDSKSNPTKLVINQDVAAVEHLEFIRGLRKAHLEILDSLQVRYLVKGRDDVVKSIEEDKDKLRNLPATIKLGKIKSLVELHHKIPVEVLVNYEEKYKDVEDDTKK